jgi:hypothetical protein
MKYPLFEEELRQIANLDCNPCSWLHASPVTVVAHTDTAQTAAHSGLCGVPLMVLANKCDDIINSDEAVNEIRTMVRDVPGWSEDWIVEVRAEPRIG